jgi:hypothetical protein
LCLILFIGIQSLPTLGTPINLVQNGDFDEAVVSWSGLVGIPHNPSAPEGSFGLGGNISQTINTTPGQLYDINFYAAADLYFGPSLTLSLVIGGQPIATIITPSYTNNPEINRYSQMVWAQYNYLFTATSATTSLDFIDENTYDFGLAEVSVTSVPDTANTMVLLGIAGLVLIGFSKMATTRYRIAASH